MPPTPRLTPVNLRSIVAPPGSCVDAPSVVLARLAERFVRSFRIHSPFAPGLCCIGGEVALAAEATSANEAPHVSATGNGRTLAAATASCLGEAADQISEFERSGDVVSRTAVAECAGAVVDGWIAEALRSCETDIDWVAATHAASGRRAMLPADLCVRRERRRRSIEPVGPLSSGVAAGPSVEDATLRGILELCERDALALWWMGGRRPRRFGAEHPASAAGLRLVEQLRQGTTGRMTSLLDISGDFDIPVVAAVSVDPNGFGLACGAAARLEAGEAAEAAILEMCQMELSAPVAAAKRAERRDSALNPSDRRHLRRAAFATADCDLLVPESPSTPQAAPSDTTGSLASLIQRLDQAGISVVLVDLTREDVGVPVVRAVSPQLQPFSVTVLTPRLAAATAARGPGWAAPNVPLL